MGFQRPTSNWLAGFLPSTVRPFFACWVHLKFNTRGTWETIFGSHPWPCHSKLPSSLLGYNACWPARVKNRLQSHFLCEFGSLFEFIQNWVCHECPLAIGGTTCWVLNTKIEYARNIPNSLFKIHGENDQERRCANWSPASDRGRFLEIAPVPRALWKLWPWNRKLISRTENANGLDFWIACQDRTCWIT